MGPKRKALATQELDREASDAAAVTCVLRCLHEAWRPGVPVRVMWNATQGRASVVAAKNLEPGELELWPLVTQKNKVHVGASMNLRAVAVQVTPKVTPELLGGPKAGS